MAIVCDFCSDVPVSTDGELCGLCEDSTAPCRGCGERTQARAYCFDCHRAGLVRALTAAVLPDDWAEFVSDREAADTLRRVSAPLAAAGYELKRTEGVLGLSMEFVRGQEDTFTAFRGPGYWTLTAARWAPRPPGSERFTKAWELKAWLLDRDDPDLSALADGSEGLIRLTLN